MKIQKIEIKNLFDQFDYDIPLTNPEDLLILTAPNGFGKTMILNIIDKLFNRKFNFFLELAFEYFVIEFENNHRIEVKKQNDAIIKFTLKKSHQESIVYTYSKASDDSIDNLVKSLSKKFPFLIYTEDWLWYNNENEELLEFEDITKKYKVPASIVDNYNKILKYPLQFSEFFYESLPSTCFIKEQRLYDFDEDEHTINTLADDLIFKIENTALEGLEISQNLDNTFPKRLLSETTKIVEQEFINRFETLRQKQAKLHKYGLSESEQEVPPYSEENARLLSVYLNDIEKKVGAFDNLIQKIDLFTTILNERRFTFKTIQINKEKGFHFVTNKGKELSLTDLSSGEQHEVVLLYELIFRTTSNTLVLIDEPEISLHITWQKEFLKDLLAIIELQKMQVIVATHSPSIINDRWDLVFNLQTQEMQ
jgi:predicted ATP-binding protein involved in virulence